MNFKEELKNNGFCVIPNVLTSDEVKENYELFKNWLDAGGEKLTKQHKVTYIFGKNLNYCKDN